MRHIESADIDLIRNPGGCDRLIQSCPATEVMHGGNNLVSRFRQFDRGKESETVGASRDESDLVGHEDGLSHKPDWTFDPGRDRVYPIRPHETFLSAPAVHKGLEPPKTLSIRGVHREYRAQMLESYDRLEPCARKWENIPNNCLLPPRHTRRRSHAGDTASHTAQSTLSVSSVAYAVFTRWHANPVRVAGLVSRSSCKVGDAPLQAEDETPPLCLTRACNDASPLARDVKPW